MATRTLDSATAEAAREGVGFDLRAALLALWFMIGLYIDGWAHNHGAVDNTFFTPYHALLYSGILANGLYLGIAQYRAIGRGRSFSRALPHGYNLSLIGVALFFAGGAFDLVWHSIFGFEANLSVLLSPAHLVLATSGFLILTGPLRAAWRRTRTAPTWANLFPVVLSLAMILSVMTFFTQFTSPFSHASGFVGRFPRGDRGEMDTLGVATVLLPIAMTMGVLLFGLRRWTLPFGAVTLILTLNAAAMLLMMWREMRPYWFVILAPLAAGLVGDGLLWRLKPSQAKPFGLRVFAFAVPFALYTIYFILLIWQSGIWWPVHMWLGVSFFAAVIGVFLSYLVMPPSPPLEIE